MDHAPDINPERADDIAVAMATAVERELVYSDVSEETLACGVAHFIHHLRTSCTAEQRRALDAYICAALSVNT